MQKHLFWPQTHTHKHKHTHTHAHIEGETERERERERERGREICFIVLTTHVSHVSQLSHYHGRFNLWIFPDSFQRLHLAVRVVTLSQATNWMLHQPAVGVPH